MASETTFKPSPLLKFERQDSGGVDSSPQPMDMSGPKKDAVYKGPILSSGGTGTPRGGSPLTVAGTSNSRTSSPAPTYTDEIKREFETITGVCIYRSGYLFIVCKGWTA
jgi:hypothetical protein